jgi:hypothetical protein
VDPDVEDLGVQVLAMGTPFKLRALVFVSATISTQSVNWALPMIVSKCNIIEYNTFHTLFGRLSLVRYYRNQQETLVQS